MTVDQKVVSSISNGILVLAAMAPGDTEKDAEKLASKILKLKLWDDEAGGRWKRSVQDIHGEVLCGEHAYPKRIPQPLMAMHSLSIHSACEYQKGQQARFPWSSERR